MALRRAYSLAATTALPVLDGTAFERLARIGEHLRERFPDAPDAATAVRIERDERDARNRGETS